MIDYKLAKQLKDAGFKQGVTCSNCKCEEGETAVYVTNPEDGRQRAFIPTLSELIDACGDGFEALSRYLLTDGSIEWGACSVHFDEKGESPEESVAKLWIKLQKQTKK